MLDLFDAPGGRRCRGFDHGRQRVGWEDALKFMVESWELGNLLPNPNDRVV